MVSGRENSIRENKVLGDYGTSGGNSEASFVWNIVLALHIHEEIDIGE